MTNIKGLGTDIIEVKRIYKSLSEFKETFMNRVFTESEIKYCMKNKAPERHFAGRFAAKEAIAKAFGCGIGQNMGWKDLEISKDSEGKPLVLLSKKIQSAYQNPTVYISISHCKEYANAVAIWF